MWSFEAQFDLVIPDRPTILQTVFQLYNHLSERRFLTWDFFLNRFDALFLEGQISLERLGEAITKRDLKNSNVNSEAYQIKLKRAEEALGMEHLKSRLSTRLAARREERLPYLTERTVIREEGGHVMGRRRVALPVPLSTGLPDKFASHFPNSFFTDAQMKEKLAMEEAQIMNILHRVVDIQDWEAGDTMHTLVFLLMQFFSRPDPAHPQEEKAMGRNQQLVLRHLNLMLGFSPTEKKFLISPGGLRSLAVFNAVLTSMPKVLDFNFQMGNLMLNTWIPLLIYCPSSQKHSTELVCTKAYYTLGPLQPHARQSWLMSVFIILYKYSYSKPPMDKEMKILISIVINTLEAEFHRCRPLPEHSVSPAHSRSRGKLLYNYLSMY